MPVQAQDERHASHAIAPPMQVKQQMSAAPVREFYPMLVAMNERWTNCDRAIDALGESLRLPRAPVIIRVAHDGPRGFYAEGVITLRDDADCSVLVHELVHHAQYLRSGAAKSSEEWYAREMEAQRVERIFRSVDR